MYLGCLLAPDDLLDNWAEELTQEQFSSSSNYFSLSVSLSFSLAKLMRRGGADLSWRDLSGLKVAPGDPSEKQR